MLKRTLIAIGVIAMMASAANAGELLIQGAWESEYVSQIIVNDIPVYIDIPYFVQIHPQPGTGLEINLVPYQGGNTGDFEGFAMTDGGQKPTLTSNFDCELTAELYLVPNGELLQGDLQEWQCRLQNAGGGSELEQQVWNSTATQSKGVVVEPMLIDDLTPTLLNIIVRVFDTDMLAFTTDGDQHVGNVDLLVRPQPGI